MKTEIQDFLHYKCFQTLDRIQDTEYMNMNNTNNVPKCEIQIYRNCYAINALKYEIYKYHDQFFNISSAMTRTNLKRRYTHWFRCKYAFVTREGEICGELTCESGRNYANSLEGPIP